MRVFRFSRLLFPALFLFALFGAIFAAHGQTAGGATLPPAPHAKTIHLKHVLVIGETKGFEHDSISAAMAAVFAMGQESGLWDTTMRTDTELLTKKDLGATRKI